MKFGAALSAHDADAWDRDGFVVLRNVVAPSIVAAAATAIWDFLDMDPEDPEHWYDHERRVPSGIDARGMVPLYHHSALWACRQNPIIYETFAALIGCRELLVSLDRVNMNPPVRSDWQYSGFVHWDIDVAARPIRPQLQGLLSLTDANAKSGGFQCVPGFHNQIENWLDAQGAGYRTRFPDTSGMNLVDIPMNAGDFLIWHGALPHGNTPNHSSTPRLAMYISMFRKDGLTAAEQQARLDSYFSGEPPMSLFSKAFPPTPRPHKQHKAVPLNDLGQQLLGLRPWSLPSV